MPEGAESVNLALLERAENRPYPISAKDRDLLLDQALGRALADDPVEVIAADYGLPRSTLNYWFVKFRPEDWKDTQAARALTAYQDACKAMDSATSQLDVARAREQLKRTQWELERLWKRLYGPENTQITINQIISDPEQVRTQILALEERLGLNAAPQLLQRTP